MDSIETVQKRAVKCIYHGKEHKEILCLTNMNCLKAMRNSVCERYIQQIPESTQMVYYLLHSKRCNKYDVRRFNEYPFPEIRSNIYRNSLIPWVLFQWK